MKEFTNETIDLAKLPQYEETEFTSPHVNYWKIIIINLVLFTLFSGAVLSAIILLNEEMLRYLPYLIGGYIFLIILLFFIYRISFKKRGFALREKDIIYKHGVIAETT